MIIRRPWLSALLLTLAIAGQVLDWLIRDAVSPFGRALLTSIVGTLWGGFGAAAFEYIKARHDLRTYVDAALVALADRSEEGLLVAVKALEAQKVNAFYDNPAVVTFVRILVLLRDSCALVRVRRWEEAQRLLGSNPLAFDREIKTLQAVPEATRELLCRVLTTNLETSTIYAGLASTFPRWDPWISERVRRATVPEWEVAVSALDDLAEATVKFMDDPWSASATERARAYGTEATLLSTTMQMAFFGKWDPPPAADVPTPYVLVDDHIRRKLGILRSRLWRLLSNSLAAHRDARYSKCLLMNNIHSGSYIAHLVEHPHGPERLYQCEKELITAAKAFEVELRIVRYNICVCLWRAGKTYLSPFDRCINLLLEPEGAADMRILISALRDFAAGEPGSGIQSLFTLMSEFKQGLGKIVTDELNKFARASGDGSAVDLNLARFKAAGMRPTTWADESGVLVGIFLPAYGDGLRSYPVFHPTLFGEAEV